MMLWFSFMYSGFPLYQMQSLMNYFHKLNHVYRMEAHWKKPLNWQSFDTDSFV